MGIEDDEKPINYRISAFVGKLGRSLSEAQVAAAQGEDNVFSRSRDKLGESKLSKDTSVEPR